MKFENKGKWLKEAEDKLAARDTMEDPDYLNGDNKVLTFEENELEDVPSDEEFEEDYLDENELDSPENEETALAMAESSQINEKHLFKRGDRVIAYGEKGTIDFIYYEDPAHLDKKFRVIMDKTKKPEVFRERELRFIRQD